MFKEFYINGDWWKIVFVNPWDKHLVDRTGEITLATSDYSEKIVFISESLNKELLTHVFLHELGHCIMFSCGLLFELHKMEKRILDSSRRMGMQFYSKLWLFCNKNSSRCSWE